MTFWTNEELRKAFKGSDEQPGVVKPFDPLNVHQAAYELGVANEYAMTSSGGEGERRRVVEGDDIVIPPGQFALLLTEEIVNIPPNAMGFISVKASWKLKGLVNVSGFHVDPGFHGRLRFAVYNASGQTLRIKPGRRLFQLWLNGLVEPLTKGALYENKLPPEAGIQDEEVMSIAGMIASPAGLSARIDSLGTRLTGELPKLEASLAKTIADKHHELTLQIKEETSKLSEKLGERIATVSAWQKAQWLFIALFFVVLIAEPLKHCNSDSKTGSNTSQHTTPAAPPPTMPAPTALTAPAGAPTATSASGPDAAVAPPQSATP